MMGRHRYQGNSDGSTGRQLHKVLWDEMSMSLIHLQEWKPKLTRERAAAAEHILV
jgi:hypothetical protein